MYSRSSVYTYAVDDVNINAGNDVNINATDDLEIVTGDSIYIESGDDIDIDVADRMTIRSDSAYINVNPNAPMSDTALKNSMVAGVAVDWNSTISGMLALKRTSL